jgi:TonB family protein
MKIMVAVSLAMLCIMAAALAQGQAPPETVYRVGGKDGASAPTCPKFQPVYTEEARQAIAEGTVVLDTVIHADGSVTVNKIVSALGHGLDEVAKKSVEELRCTAGQLNGKTVSVSLRIAVNFHL